MEVITIYRNKEGTLKNTSKGDVGKNVDVPMNPRNSPHYSSTFPIHGMLYVRLVNDL